MESIGFMGADVSKGHCDFVLTDCNGVKLGSTIKLDDTHKGHDMLKSGLSKAKREHGFDKIVVGIESTGGYENNWYRMLHNCDADHEIEVFRINPTRIYHESRAEGRKSIDDGVSALVIAGHIRKNYGLFLSLKQDFTVNEEKRKHLRSLHKYIGLLSKQQVRVKNSLEKVLYSSIPELMAFKGEKYSKWFLEMLQRFPGKEQIIEGGIAGLTQIKYVTSKRATEVVEAVQKSIGANDSITSELIKDMSGEIVGQNTKIKRLNAELTALARTIFGSSIDLITGINGIGEDTATKLILEIGHVHRFESASKLVAFFGVNPVVKTSGDYAGKAKMSKAGSSVARAVLFMAAQNAIRYNPLFKAIYVRHRGRGKSHKAAIVIVMSKLIRIIYGMLKSNQA